MEHLKQRFPPGVDYRIIYDTTMFVKEAITPCWRRSSRRSLLVLVVVLVFLQKLAVDAHPDHGGTVSLIGAFAVMPGIRLFAITTHPAWPRPGDRDCG